MTKNNSKTKNNLILRILAGIMLMLTVFFALPKVPTTVSVSASTIAEDQQRIKKMKEELAMLRSTSNTATAAYEEAYAIYKDAMMDYEKAMEAKKALDAQVTALETEIEKTQTLLNTYNEQIQIYDTQIKEKEAEIEERYDLFIERIRINYEDSFSSYLHFLLNSESFADFLYHMDMMGSLLDYDKRVLASLDQSKKDLEALMSQYQTLQFGAQETLTSLEEMMPTLEGKRMEATALLAELEAAYELAYTSMEASEEQKKYIESQVGKKEAELAKADAELDKKIKEQQERDRKENYVGGKLGWPTELCYNYVSSYFGTRTNPIYGYQEFHNGIDIPAAYGSNIYAANDGQVIVSEWHYSYGYYVVIDHGGGVSTLYAHNSKLIAKVGDWVSKGDVIAKAGSTGYSTGSHCHFSVREHGTPVNPFNYVVKP